MLQLLRLTPARSVVLYEFDVQAGARPALLQLRTETRHTSTRLVMSELGSWLASLMRDRQNLVYCVGIHGVEHLAPETVDVLLAEPAADIVILLEIRKVVSPSRKPVPASWHDRVVQLERVDRRVLESWLVARGLSVMAGAGEHKIGNQTPQRIAAELLQDSDGGVPELLYEAICRKAGVRWRDVQEHAARRFSPPRSVPAVCPRERLGRRPWKRSWTRCAARSAQAIPRGPRDGSTAFPQASVSSLSRCSRNGRSLRFATGSDVAR